MRIGIIIPNLLYLRLSITSSISQILPSSLLYPGLAILKSSESETEPISSSVTHFRSASLIFLPPFLKYSNASIAHSIFLIEPIIFHCIVSRGVIILTLNAFSIALSLERLLPINIPLFSSSDKSKSCIFHKALSLTIFSTILTPDFLPSIVTTLT